MFQASSRPSSGAQQLQEQPLVLPLERGGSSAVGRGRASRPDHDQRHYYHHVFLPQPNYNRSELFAFLLKYGT